MLKSTIMPTACILFLLVVIIRSIIEFKTNRQCYKTKRKELQLLELQEELWQDFMKELRLTSTQQKKIQEETMEKQHNQSTYQVSEMSGDLKIYIK